MNQLYQLFDNRQFTQCESLLNQYLSKYPQNLHLLTLKAHLIMHLHNSANPNTLSQSALFPNQISMRAFSQIKPIIHKLLHTQYPPKDTITQDESIWFRSVCLLFKQLAMYEECFEFMRLQVERYKNIKSEELWNYAFFSLCRVDGYFDVQATWAMKMYQFWKNNKYLKWAHLSSWMHNDEKRRQLALVLAHKSLLAYTDKFDDEWLRFVLGMMKETNQWGNVVDLLLDWRSESIDMLLYDRKTFLAEALRKNKQYYEASAMYAYLLEQDNEEWTWWSGFLGSLKDLRETDSSSTLATQETITLAYNTGNDKSAATLQLTNHARAPHEFIKRMQQKELEEKGSHRARRGTFLAELEYLFTLESSATDELRNRCIEYFERFATKSLCFSDLRKYITVETYHAIRERIQQSAPWSSDPVESVRATISLRKLERYLRVYTHQDTEYLTTLIAEYRSALELGMHLEKTENQHGDDFLLLSVHYMLDSIDADTLCSRTLDTATVSTMLQCTYLLEWALEKSAYNYEFKVLLIRLYSLLGAVHRAAELFESMEIKHTLWESLSYMVVYDAFDKACFSAFEPVAKRVLDFRYQHERETPDLLLLAYRNETYSKVSEFIDFQQKIDTSISTNLCASQALLLDLSFTSIAETIIEKLQLNLKPFHRIQAIAEHPNRTDDLSVLLNFQTQDPEAGHPIIVPRVLKETGTTEQTPFYTASYALIVHVLNALAELIFNKEQLARKAKLSKQLSKKKKTKKLASNMVELPSDAELEERGTLARKNLREASELYDKLLTQNESLKGDALWANLQALIEISFALAIDQSADKMKTLSERFHETSTQISSQLSGESSFVGKYAFHVRICVMVMNLWRKLVEGGDHTWSSSAQGLVAVLDRVDAGLNRFKEVISGARLDVPEFASALDGSSQLRDRIEKHLERGQQLLTSSMGSNQSMRVELQKL